jgi:Protein of unknown function (DUF3667)
MPDPSPTQAPTLQRCPNCFVALATPQPKFCPECGQETRVRAPKLGEFVQQLGGAYLSTEGAIWRTLWLLIFKPGELTRQYLAGRRKHYVLPLRLYLTVSVLVLLGLRLQTHLAIETQLTDAPKPVAASASDAADGLKAASVEPDKEAAKSAAKSAEISAEKGDDKTALSNAQINLGAGRRAGIKDGVFYCENLPGWVCERLNRRMRVNKAEIAREMASVGERVVANLGLGMFLMLPTFALWLKLLYLGSGKRYTEHLVFALHVHAFWFLMLALVWVEQTWLSIAAALAVPLYTLLAMRRVYGGGWWPRLVRSALLVVLYGVTMTLTLMTLVLGVLVT